ncbi:MAG TPA: sulfotransferase [Verrucomicrobiae bacterium]|nr:sulfotransferase [Verrucomicrobiae bacterium]
MVRNDGHGLVFILSPPRSGSTLLGAMLANHPQALCPPEPWLLLPLGALRSPDSEIIAAYDHGLAGAAWNDSVPDQLFDQAVRAFALAAYNSWLREAHREVFVDKTPRYYHVLPWLERLFPKAFKVRLLRNPLDVVSSCKQTWNLTIDEIVGDVTSPHSFDTTISFALLSAYFASGTPYQYQLRYEDLVRDPASQIAKLCRFIGLPPVKSLHRYGTNRVLMKAYKDAQMGDKKILEHEEPHTHSINCWEKILTTGEIKQTLFTLGRAVFVRDGYADVLAEAAGRAGLDASEIPEAGRLDQIFDHYRAYSKNRLPSTTGGARTLIERDNLLLRDRLTESEADRAARLVVIQQQGQRIAELEGEVHRWLQEIKQLSTKLTETGQQTATEISALQSERSRLSNELEQQRAAIDAHTQEIQTQRAAFEQEKAGLLTRLDKTRNDLAAAEADRGRLSAEIERYSGELDRARTAFEESQRSNETLTRELQTAHARLDTQARALDSAVTSLEEARARLKEYQLHLLAIEQHWLFRFLKPRGLWPK